MNIHFTNHDIIKSSRKFNEAIEASEPEIILPESDFVIGKLFFTKRNIFPAGITNSMNETNATFETTFIPEADIVMPIVGPYLVPIFITEMYPNVALGLHTIHPEKQTPRLKFVKILHNKRVKIVSMYEVECDPTNFIKFYQMDFGKLFKPIS